MADRKITDLTALAAGSQATGDLLTIVDVSEGAAADKNKKITVESLFKGIPGNVGVGTSSPARILHTSGDLVRFDNNGPSAILLLDTTNNEGFRLITNRTSGAFSIEDMGTAVSGAGTERLVIDSSGNVGIGVSSLNSSSRLTLLESAGNAQTLEIKGANSGGVGSQPGIKFTANNGDNIGGIYGDTNADAVILQTGGTERMRIDSSGDLRLEEALRIQYNTASTDSRTWYIRNDIHAYGDLAFRRSTTQTGATFETKILFKDTGGICFNGDTAAANALADYERGTWTPTINRSSTSPSVTYTERIGRYVKVGDIVTVFFDVTASSISGGSGSTRVTGLPFNMPSGHAGYSAVQWRSSNAFAVGPAQTILRGYVEQGQAYVVPQLDNMGTNGYGLNSQPSWASSGRITGYVTYQTGT